MSKFTKLQKNELKSIVANAMIRRLSIVETQQYVKDNLKVDISEDYLYHLRSDLKNDCARELELLAKDRDYYINNVFFARIHELEAQQQVLWDIVNNNKDKPEIQIKAVHELRALSIDLKNGYQTLPAITGLEVPIPIPFEQQQQEDDFFDFGDNENDNKEPIL